MLIVGINILSWVRASSDAFQRSFILNERMILIKLLYKSSNTNININIEFIHSVDFEFMLRERERERERGIESHDSIFI